MTKQADKLWDEASLKKIKEEILEACKSKTYIEDEKITVENIVGF